MGSLPVQARRNSVLLFSSLLAALLFFGNTSTSFELPGGLNNLGTIYLAGVVTSAIAGFGAVPMLQRLKASQVVRLDGPKEHLQKAGTPTMGGLFLVPAGVAVAVAFAGATPEVVAVSVITVLCGTVGFVDDLQILLKKSSKGISGKTKLVCQSFLALCFCWWASSVTPRHFGAVVPLVRAHAAGKLVHLAGEDLSAVMIVRRVSGSDLWTLSAFGSPILASLCLHFRGRKQWG